MPLELRNLGVIGYLQGTTHWSYRTPDSRRELEGSTYWADAYDMLKPGDWLFVSHLSPNGPGSGHTIYGVGPGPRLHRLVSTFSDSPAGQFIEEHHNATP